MRAPLAAPAPVADDATASAAREVAPATASTAPAVEPARAASVVGKDEPLVVAPAPRVAPVRASTAPTVGTAVAAPAARDEEGARAEPAVVDVDAAPVDVDADERPRVRPTSVAALRRGAHLESEAAVVARPDARTWYQKWFPVVFEERNFLSFGEARKLVLVKEGRCFVFHDEHSVAPLYAIPLRGGNDDDDGSCPRPVLEDRKRPHPMSITISPEGVRNLASESMSTVLLMSSDDKKRDKILYQFTFKSSSEQDASVVAERFANLVSGAGRVSTTKGEATLRAEVSDCLLSSKR